MNVDRPNHIITASVSSWGQQPRQAQKTTFHYSSTPPSSWILSVSFLQCFPNLTWGFIDVPCIVEHSLILSISMNHTSLQFLLPTAKIKLLWPKLTSVIIYRDKQLFRRQIACPVSKTNSKQKQLCFHTRVSDLPSHWLLTGLTVLDMNSLLRSEP